MTFSSRLDTLFMKLKRVLLALSTAALWISCQKDTLELPHIVMSLPTGLDLANVHFINDDTGIVATGKPYFTSGELFQTVDGGDSWQRVLTTPQAMLKIIQHDTMLYATMYGNAVYKRGITQTDWTQCFMLGWGFWRAAAFNRVGQGFAIGGENFDYGYVQRFDTGARAIDDGRQYFVHNLADACLVNDSVGFAVGYGVILKTTNCGKTWSPASAKGDFYRSISFPNERTGFVVGEYGSLLKTSNMGESWSKLQHGSTFLNKKNRPQAVCFVSDTEGYIVGRNGLFRKTTDGGDSWQDIATSESIDWANVQCTRNFIFLVGSDGALWRFDR